MKTTAPGFTQELKRQRLEADLAARLERLFGRCPSLCGFSVQKREGTVHDYDVAPLEGDLFVTDVGIYPAFGAEHCGNIYDEITVALLDFMYERPEARHALRGRTFARILH